MPCPARPWLEVKINALLSPSPAFIGHRHWVLSISWSPDGKKLASGCKNGQVGDIWMKGQSGLWHLEGCVGEAARRCLAGRVSESYSMSFCPSDSPVGPKHRDAGGQDPQRPQQVDHRPELGAPSCVSDTKLRGVNWIKSAPSPFLERAREASRSQ